MQTESTLGNPTDFFAAEASKDLFNYIPAAAGV
jgi:hypothetical protein